MRIIALLATLLIARTLGAQTIDAGTPTAVPRIIETSAAAPGVIAVSLETKSRENGVNTQSDALDLDPSHWRINNTTPLAVHRYSMPWDASKADTSVSPNPVLVTVRHYVFLRTGSPLQEGGSYALTTPYGSTSLVFRSRNTRCLALKVNQVGYSSIATSRFANFGVYLGDGGTFAFNPLPAYEVIRESDGAVVTSGTAVDMGADTALIGPHSGEHVYRLSLNAVSSGGPYFVSVPGCGRSRPFGVGDAYSRQIAYVATRGLYHQRCGIALERPYTPYTRSICHTRVADTRTPWVNGMLRVPAGTPTIPKRGGYHDAGDFDIRPFHVVIPQLILEYFEAFPTHFVDHQYNIPESGNGIPDFLDEALWGLLIWENLQITATGDPQYGGVRAGTERDAHPGYGTDSAANERAVYGTWGVLEDVTAISAGMFAQASRLVRRYDPARADSLLNRARMAWAYLSRTGNVHSAKSHFMYAALQLYLATGEAAYHDIFKAAADTILVKGGTWPEQYVPGNTSASCQTAHFLSYLLPTARPTDATLVDALKARIIAAADSGGYMNVDTERSPYPQGVNKFFGWGSFTSQGRYADAYIIATLFQRDAAKRQRYINTVSHLADYSLGLNPLSMSYYTGLGVDQPQSPGHCDSYWTKYGLSDGVTSDHAGHPIGNVPGILVYGPTSGRSNQTYQLAISNKMSPRWDNLSYQRRYGGGWPLLNSNEFTVHETMVWNIVMHGYLYDDSRDPQLPPPRDAGLPDVYVPPTDAGAPIVCIQPPVICGPQVAAPRH